MQFPILFQRTLPIAVTAISIIVVAYSALSRTIDWFHFWGSTEAGIVEIGTVLLAFIGIYLSFRNFRERKNIPHPLFGVYMLLFMFGFFYIAMEETSYGQHLLGWETPNWLAAANLQEETNLHNLFDKKIDRIPKAILGALIVIGGLLIPLYLKIWGKAAVGSGSFDIYRPNDSTIIVALCFLIVWLLGRGLVIADIHELIGLKLHFSEVRELLITYFLVLYTWEFRRFSRTVTAEATA